MLQQYLSKTFDVYPDAHTTQRMKQTQQTQQTQPHQLPNILYSYTTNE